VLKNRGLKRLVDKNLTNNHTHDFIPLSEVYKIAIMYRKSKLNTIDLNLLLDSLKEVDKDPTVLEFVNKIDKDTLQSPQLYARTISYKDFGLFGDKPSEKIKKFTNISFDYLFCLNTSPFLPFENILSASKAKCRVGIAHPNNKRYYEIAVQLTGNESLQEISKELLRCLKMIKRY
jgi:hypothetical protein